MNRMPLEVKICGLKSSEALLAAIQGGARYVGFVFFPPSPRFLELAQAAALAATVPSHIIRVGVVADADDVFLDEIVRQVSLDMLQLHGHEAPGRVAGIKARWALPVTKAIAVSERVDLSRSAEYEPVADRLLFDAEPPRGASRPGGNALPLDWALLRGLKCRVPWLLAGGLDATNLGAAVVSSGAIAVDVSSGVEDAPGIKNVAKIAAFLDAARGIAVNSGLCGQRRRHLPSEASSAG